LVLSGPGSDLHVGQGLAPGWHGLKAPQGVTLARSGVRNARNIVEQFMEPGRPMAAVAREMPEGVRLTGFLPATQAFTDEEPDPLQAPDYVAELAYWAAVQDTGTVEAADAYLNRYPRGQFASDARAMKDELQSDSLREVRDGERGLNLSRDQRMEIQRQLTLLGFDPRGIDGVFGRGTRSAIKTWQTRNGMDGTGYMDRAQWRLLRQQAKLEADRREREAQRRQAEMEKQDRAYWRETGRGETEQGLREYLRHYPDGMFADEAREQLRLIQEERRKTAARAERKAWDQAVQKDTLGSYQGFLNRFPKSQFAGAARDRMAELQDMLANREALDRARSEEDMIIDNEVTRVLIERRLASLDLLDERQADGMFNDKTRRALRQFQRLMNLPPSGYVTRMTLINLLASLGEDPQH
jgi:peptidoglycan hydrolase-like protein with peptidoglycan-binding domain